jgi:hypothetical protein
MDYTLNSACVGGQGNLLRPTIVCLNIGFANCADQRRRLQHRQLERIQNKLEGFLSPLAARETTMGIYDLVLEVDDGIDRILRDPLVRKFYEYEGRFFIRKSN